MSLLKNRNYILLRIGWSISSLGSRFQSFAFSLYVLALTGSAAKFSVTLCMEILPMILCAPLSGFFSDRLNRKRQIVLYDLLSAATVLSFFGLFRTNGRLLVWQVYLCVFLLSMLQTFFVSVASCLAQAVVDPSDYTLQKSVDSTVSSLIAIFAPALAGLLFGLSGIGAILIVNAVSFLISAVLECLPHISASSVRPGQGEEVSFYRSIREGYRFMRKNAFLMSTLFLLAVLNFILPAVEIGFMVVSQTLMRLSPVVIGVENSVLSAGVLAGAIFCGLFRSRMEKISFSRFVAADACSIVVSFLCIGVWLLVAYPRLSSGFNALIFVLCNFIILFVNSVLSVNFSAQFQRSVPNEMMGRIAALTNAVLTAVTPLGQMVAGFLMGGIPYFAAYFAEGALTSILLVFSVKSARKPAIIETGYQMGADPVEQTCAEKSGGY